MIENVWTHYGRWSAVIIWVILYGLFLAFIPFYKKSQSKPASAYLAFVIAFALEMFGIPFSLYVVTWLFGFTLSEGVFWGHTLVKYIGFWGMYIGLLISLIGALLVIFGWKEIYRHYWSKEEGKGRLVKKGIYAYIRHPQYTGFLLITLGMLFEWVTIPLLIMYPMLCVLYYRLARREERDMEQEFGHEYMEYKRRTGMFLPIGKSKKQRNLVGE
jgi:protein-S-isoprenylcysteine O-methyltransferase Ste14